MARGFVAHEPEVGLEQLLLLIPTVSILPTTLVMAIGEPAIGTLLMAGALFGAVGTILTLRAWGQRPSVDIVDVD